MPSYLGRNGIGSWVKGVSGNLECFNVVNSHSIGLLDKTIITYVETRFGIPCGIGSASPRTPKALYTLAPAKFFKVIKTSVYDSLPWIV
jgi:hypothetical protein